MCPPIEAVAAPYAPASPATSQPTTPATTPFTMSIRITSTPHALPTVCIVLKPPGLPLPTARMSTCPRVARRVTSSAVGNVPTKYPASTAATVNAASLTGREPTVVAVAGRPRQHRHCHRDRHVHPHAHLEPEMVGERANGGRDGERGKREHCHRGPHRPDPIRPQGHDRGLDAEPEHRRGGTKDEREEHHEREPSDENETHS